jgi:hypothetical protein
MVPGEIPGQPDVGSTKQRHNFVMKKRNRLRWTLMSTEKPSRPGHYMVGCLYYPEVNLGPQKITDIFTTDDMNKIANLPYEEEVVVWYGPIQIPKILIGTMTRLKREQAKFFVRTHEKHCVVCGALSGVNARSMPYLDDMEDCKKCGEKSAVEIRQKAKTLAETFNPMRVKIQ